MNYPTSVFEGLLLGALVVLLPLQEQFPSLGGFSVIYLLFAIMAGYVMMHRPQAVNRVWLHPVFVSSYFLIGLALLIEHSHPYPSYYELARIAPVIGGAVFVAALTRDHRALRYVMVGTLIAGMWVSIYVLFTTYGTISGAVAEDFGEASNVRNEAFKDSALRMSPNTMGFYTAQGAVVALAIALTTQSFLGRSFFLGLASFNLVANFFNMSRGGAAIAIVSCFAVLYVHGLKHLKTLIPVAVLGVGIMIAVPQAVFSRFTLTTESQDGKVDARTRLFRAVLEHFPEFVATGVGQGNFTGPWGSRSNFARLDGAIIGAHNGPIQLTIYWGLPALLALIAIIFNAYFCLPKGHKNDYGALCVYGIAVSALLFLQVHHVLGSKQFALALGIIVAGRCWIWPRTMTHRPARNRVAPIHYLQTHR